MFFFFFFFFQIQIQNVESAVGSVYRRDFARVFIFWGIWKEYVPSPAQPGPTTLTHTHPSPAISWLSLRASAEVAGCPPLTRLLRFARTPGSDAESPPPEPQTPDPTHHPRHPCEPQMSNRWVMMMPECHIDSCIQIGRAVCLWNPKISSLVITHNPKPFSAAV